MKAHNSKIWSAYLDGELSAAEAAEFDKSLTPAERSRLTAETRFENALGECLRSGPACPESVWRTVQARVSTAAKRPARKTAWSTWAAAAAVLLIVGTAYAANAWINKVPSFAAIQTSDEVEFEGVCNLPRLFRAHHWGVTLATPDTVRQGHVERARMMGVHEGMYKSQPVVEVFYQCCGQPVKLVLMQRGSPAATVIEEMVSHPGHGQVMAVRPVGNTIVALVGNHYVPELLDTIVLDAPNHA